MVYVLLADGFEEVEALCPVDLMRRGGIDVVTVSINKTNTVIGSHNITVEADTNIRTVLRDSLIADHIEALVLPGGMPGTTNLDADENVDKMIAIASITDSWIAAICAAPMILGKRGLLDGKKAICYPGFEEFLKGAEYTATLVEQDGNIITGKGPGAAMDFAFAIVEKYVGIEKVKELKQGMMIKD